MRRRRLGWLAAPLLLAERRRHVWSPAGRSSLWMAALSVLFIPTYSGTACSELVRAGGFRWQRVWDHGVRTLAVGALAAGAMALLTHRLLELLGQEYALNGAYPLQLVVAGVPAVTILPTYYAVCRATDRLLEATWTALGSGVATVTIGAWLMHGPGLIGVAGAWLASQSAAALWALWRLRRVAAAPPALHDALVPERADRAGA